MQSGPHANHLERVLGKPFGVGGAVLMHDAASPADEPRWILRFEVVLTVESGCLPVVGRASGSLLMQYSLHATIQERAHALGIGCTMLMHGVASSAGGLG